MSKPEEKKVEEHVDQKTEELKKAFGDVLAPMKELVEAQAETIKELSSRLEKSERASVKSVLVGGEEKEVSQLEEKEAAEVFAKALFKGDVATLKTLTEGVNADGGYTVPAPLANEIIEIAEEYGVVAPLVEQVQMASKTLDITELVKTGVSLTWESEFVAASDAEPTFGRVVLTAYKVRGKVTVTTELVEDSAFDIVSVVKRMLGEKLGAEIDDVICQGTGVGQPEGIFVNAAITAAKSTGALSYDKIVDIKKAIKPALRRGASWLIHSDEVASIEKIKDGDGRPVWREGLAAGSPTTLLGYPVTETDSVPAGELAFGNYKRAYWLGKRLGLTVELNKDYDKDANIIYIRQRIAGKVVLPTLIKKHTLV